MDILRITAFGVVAAVLAVTLRKDAPAIALLISLAAGAMVLLAALPGVSALTGLLKSAEGWLGAGARYIGVIVKIVGVAYAAEFGAQVCADAGEGALAAKLELAGKAAILALAAPVVMDMLEMVAGMVG